MSEELNCEKHGQQIRSLEARVKNNEDKIDSFTISLTENNTITQHIDKTMGEFSKAIESLGKTLTKVDINLTYLADALEATNRKVVQLEENTNKKLGELENKMCDDQKANNIDIRTVWKNILLYFLLPTTIIGSVATMILVAIGVI